MRTVVLSKSDRAAKKYKVRVGNKTIHFGAAGYEDFTTHKDPKRKARYLAQHKNEIGTTQRQQASGHGISYGTRTLSKTRSQI